MSFKTRISKVEQAIEPQDKIVIRCVLRSTDDPEPEYPAGTLVIRVGLGELEESSSDENS